jgi:hypothetical protein
VAFTDCEVRDEWFFEQDVNAWSSLAYLAAAGLVLAGVRHRSWPHAFLLLALLLALEGVGSLAYHGASAGLGEALHDVALVGLLAFCAGWHARIGGPSRAAVVGAIGAVAVAGALWRPVPVAIEAVVLLAAMVIVASVVRDRRLGRTSAVGLRVVALVGVALAVWGAGTPGSPLCRERSVLQPHAVWHVASAAVVVIWAARSADDTSTPSF